ncbi:MAG TPA: PRC-barrel domain-containing protein [Nodularia sp. (in: cyanobacteria)]|nr:PRC-barrel domain-containing protein [Nodularia sp. (in: cyanobacteria)]
MSTPSQVLKHSDLLKRLVLDRETVAEVGRVSQLLLDSQAQRILGFTCKSGWLGNQQQTFAWREIEAIGADSVLVRHRDDHTDPITESVNPVLGSEVWTNSGNKVGKIIDLLFDKETGYVVNYMFSVNGWQGLVEGTYLLAPIMISSVGDKRVIVLEKAVNNPQKYTEGLVEKINQATEFIQRDYGETKQHIESVKPSLQKAIDQVKGSERISQATEFIQKNYEQTKQDFQSAKPSFQKVVDKVKGVDKIKTDKVEENISTAETKLQSEPSKFSPETGNFSDGI